MVFRPSVFDRYVSALSVTRIGQALLNCSKDPAPGFRRPAAEEPDHRHRRLLCARRERPSERRTAEKRDELAPFYSITSSASASSVGDNSRPSALAAVRLIMNSYLVGCWNGRSPGFSPRKMRST